MDQDAEILKAAMEGIKNERAKHTSRVVDPKTVPRLPRMSGMRVEPGTRVPSSRGQTGGNPSVLTFASGSKTKTLTGKGVIAKARREAKELSLFSARKSLLTTPTHQLSGKATQIRHVPQGMLEDHRRFPVSANPQTDPKPTTIIAPRKRKASSEIVPPTAMSNEERERRLKAFTALGNARQADLPTPQIKYKSLRVSSAPGSGSSSRARSPSGMAGSPPPKANKEVNPFMPTKRRRA